jgi:hypothetical protein
MAETCGGLCAGVIGLGPSSRIWSIWNRATLDKKWIILGQERKKQSILGTMPFIESTSTQNGHPVNITNYHHRHNVSLKIIGIGRTKVPEPLYDDLFYLRRSVSVANIKLTITPESSIQTTYRGVKESRVVTGTSMDRIELGSMLFENYVIHIDRFNDTMTFYSSQSDSSGRSILIWHQLFIGLFWFTFLYWKTTNLAHLYDYDRNYTWEKISEAWAKRGKLSNNERVYWNFKVTYTLILCVEIVTTAVLFLVNGPSSYHPTVDYFLGILFWLSWVMMIATGLLAWVNNLFFSNYDQRLLQFSCWLRASADISLITIIVILLLNGTNINTGMGIIVVFFQCALLFTLLRTTVTFIALMILTKKPEVMIHILISLVISGLGIWISWEFFFNSLLTFISETLSIDVNIISAALVLVIICLTVYFHRLFLVSTDQNIRNRRNKVKKQ